MQKIKLNGIDSLFVKGSSDKAIFFLHGYGANCQDLFPLHEYLDPDQYFNWYFPDGPIGIQFSGVYEGKAWFSIDINELEESMRSGRPRTFSNKSSDELYQCVSQLDQYISGIKNQYSSVIAGGFSQGAMVASHLSDLQGLILLSGVLFDEKHLSKKICQFKQLKVFQSHGKNDPLLSYDEGLKLKNWLTDQGAGVTWEPFIGQHEIPPMVISKLKVFLNSFK